MPKCLLARALPLPPFLPACVLPACLQEARRRSDSIKMATEGTAPAAGGTTAAGAAAGGATAAGGGGTTAGQTAGDGAVDVDLGGVDQSSGGGGAGGDGAENGSDPLLLLDTEAMGPVRSPRPQLQRLEQLHRVATLGAGAVRPARCRCLPSTAQPCTLRPAPCALRPAP